MEGPLLIEATELIDERGAFMETYKETAFKAAGINDTFSQDNHSLSARNVMRGLHFQKNPYAQAKIIRVVSGKAFDVGVDIRKNSRSFGKWFHVILSAENRTMLYLPAGFAHGFLALSDGTELLYKTSAEYNPSAEGGIRFDDPEIGIQWPVSSEEMLISQKDLILPFLKEAEL
jgi:dTDP-4-dehydrorhamnose 3,5-epimerase